MSGARVVLNVTDVDGVYTLDPRQYSEAEIISELSVPDLRKIVEEHNIEKLILIEKSDALNGMLPPFSMSVATALYPLGTLFRSFIVGMGGRDVTRDEFNIAKKKMESVTDMKGSLYTYLGVRETKQKIVGVDK